MDLELVFCGFIACMCNNNGRTVWGFLRDKFIDMNASAVRCCAGRFDHYLESVAGGWC